MGNQNAAHGLATLGWVCTALLLMMAFICLAAGAGKLRANGVIGIRIPAVMRSEAAWKAGHAAGVVPAFISCAVGLACSAVGLITSVAYFGAIVALVGGLIWVVIRAVRAANTD